MDTRTLPHLITPSVTDERLPLSNRLTRCAAALADAVYSQDLHRAHRWACELRELGWAAGLPGPAATAGVLAMRLSGTEPCPGEIDLAFGETLAEAYKAISQLV